MKSIWQFKQTENRSKKIQSVCNGYEEAGPSDPLPSVSFVIVTEVTGPTGLTEEMVICDH
jgi:hypothetical protein